MKAWIKTATTVADIAHPRKSLGIYSKLWRLGGKRHRIILDTAVGGVLLRFKRCRPNAQRAIVDHAVTRILMTTRATETSVVMSLTRRSNFPSTRCGLDSSPALYPSRPSAMANASEIQHAPWMNKIVHALVAAGILRLLFGVLSGASEATSVSATGAGALESPWRTGSESAWETILESIF